MVGYRSLEDFLVGSQLTLDGQVDHGAVWGLSYQVKGREIEATILFADIEAFSSRTRGLTPTQTLLFVNQFFSFVSAAALHNAQGIVDKYIGDEIMVIFSREFGSEDPISDAIRTACWIGEFDPLQFRPHIGIAHGEVTVGYVGSPIKYDCSVFGAPVTLASRCAGANRDLEARASITLPAELWAGRDLADIFPGIPIADGNEVKYRPHRWTVDEPSEQHLKGFGEVALRQIVNRSVVETPFTLEETMRSLSADMERAGYYRPRYRPADGSEEDR